MKLWIYHFSKILRNFIFLMMIILSLSFTALIWILTDSEKSLYVFKQILPFTKDFLTIETINGDWRHQLRLHNIIWHDQYRRLTIRQLQLDWNASALWSFKQFQVNLLKMQGIEIELFKSDESPSDFDPSQPIQLPVTILINQVQLDNIIIIQAKNRYLIEQLKLKLATQGNQFIIPQFQLQAYQAHLTIRGYSQLGSYFPCRFYMYWKMKQKDYGNWRAEARLYGDLQQLYFSQQLLQPFQLQQQIFIANILKNIQFKLETQWQKFYYPFNNIKTAQFFSKQGKLKINGNLQKYRVHLKAQLAQAPLPLTELNLQMIASSKQAQIQQLQLRSPAGFLSIIGQVMWQPQLNILLQLQTRQFNPAIINNQLSAHLNIASIIQAQQQRKQWLLNWNLQQLTGDIRGYPVEAKGQLQFKNQQWLIPIFQANIANNQLKIKGHIHPKQSALQLSLQAPELQKLVSDLSGNVQLQANIHGTFINPSIQLQLNAQQLHYQHYQLAKANIDLDYDITDPKHYSFLRSTLKQLRVNNQVLTEGKLLAQGYAKQHQLQLELIVPQGKMISEVQARWEASQWLAQIRQLQFQIPELGQWQLVKPVPFKLQKLVNDFQAELAKSCWQHNTQDQFCIQGKYFANKNFIADITAQLSTNLAQKWLPETLKLQANLQLQAHLQQQQQQLSANYHLQLPIQQCLWIDQQRSYLLPFQQLITQGYWQNNQLKTETKLQLTGNSQLQTQIVIDTRYFDPIDVHLTGYLATELMKPWMPPNLQFSTGMQLQFAFHQQQKLTQGHYRIEILPNSLHWQDKIPFHLPIHQAIFEGNIENNWLNNQWNIVFDQHYLRGQFGVELIAPNRINGEMNVAINHLNQLKPFLVEQVEQLQGQLQANIHISGYNIQPQFTGQLKINQVNATLPKLGIHLRDLSILAKSDEHNPDKIRLQASTRSGAGELILNGQMNLQSNLGFPVQMQLTGKNFEVYKQPDIQVALSPQLTLHFANNRGLVKGQLWVENAQIKLPQFPEKALLPTPDEYIIGETQPVAETTANLPTQMNTDIELDLGKNTHFSGIGLNTDLIGKLKINQNIDQMMVYGHVDMQKARYKSYGQDLTVKRGRFLFNGVPTNPYLDLEATRLAKSKQVTAIVKVNGALNALQTQISSDPVLPESDALAYLITGRSLSQVSKTDGNAIASAALAYGGGQMSWLTEKFGIDEFEIEEGETLKDSLVAIGQYITPDFYIGAKVGLFNKQTALLFKYHITDHFSISTQTGDSQRINLNYDFNID